MEAAAAHAPVRERDVAALAAYCGAPADNALAVAHVYRLLSPEAGAQQVVVCRHIHCTRDGSGELMAALQRICAGRPVSLSATRCFGHCGEGPCVKVNDALLTGATPRDALARLELPGEDSGKGDPAPGRGDERG